MEKNPHALYQGLRLTQRIKNKTEEVLKFTWREVNETGFSFNTKIHNTEVFVKLSIDL